MMSERLPFIDWMKSLGMLVIVYGHTAGVSVGEVTQPFNPKQLGVALFIFVMGFSLARETRGSARVLYNRLFEMYLFGWLFALLISVILLLYRGDLNESNYLPLVLGVNVLLNHFPANPTTWYIGTYLHLLVFWALFARRWRIRLWSIAAIALLEIPLRALLMDMRGDYVAYTVLTNWLSVFLLGLWAGQQPFAASPPVVRTSAWLGVLVAMLVGWPFLTSAIGVADGFPFRRLTADGRLGTLLLTSAAVTLLYHTYAWALFECTRRLPDLAIVRFFARNTIIVFIAHMPLVYALTPLYYEWLPPGGVRVVVNLLIFFVGLSFAAEGLRRAIQPLRVRAALERLGLHLTQGPRASA